MDKVEEIIDLGDLDERFYAIVGRGDENLKLFSQLFGVKVLARGTEIRIRGEEEKVQNMSRFIREILKEFAKGPLSSEEVRERAKAFVKGTTEGVSPDAEEVVLITYRKKAIVPKTENQRIYIREIREKDIVFGIGPAGSCPHEGKQNKQDHPNKTGGRSWRKVGLPSGHHSGKGRPLPSSSLRRTV
jgi:phosphate starvation-inducible PhoH-like protein